MLLAHRRVELHAVKEGLDAEAKAKRLAAENMRILATVQRFFGLSDYEGPTVIQRQALRASGSGASC